MGVKKIIVEIEISIPSDFDFSDEIGDLRLIELEIKELIENHSRFNLINNYLKIE